jgi:hypothetical protein
MKEIQLKTPQGRSNMTFTDGTGGHEEKLVILLWGPEHCGKSRLLATGPEVAGIVPTDRKCRFTVEKTMNETGKKILMPTRDFVREAIRSVRAGWMTEEKNAAEIEKLTEESKAAYRTLINEVKECTWILNDQPQVQVVCIDSFSQFYEDVKYAHYGRVGHLMKKLNNQKMFKDTREADQEIQDFVDSLTGKHLILTHKSKPEYSKNNAATGRDIWAGYKDLGYKCNLQIELALNKNFDPNSEEEDKNWHYGLSIVKSLHKPELEGEAGKLCLKDDMITLDILMQVVLG